MSEEWDSDLSASDDVGGSPWDTPPADESVATDTTGTDVDDVESHGSTSEISNSSGLSDDSEFPGPPALESPLESVQPDPTAAVDLPVPDGMEPQMWVDPSTVVVDPTAATVVGSPSIDSSYFQTQITGEPNANCGPFSAAMAINAMTGSSLSGEEVARFAQQQGWMTWSPDGNPAWGGWSGMGEEDLEKLVDSYVGASGLDAQRQHGVTTSDLEGHLAAGHPVIVAVDQAELNEFGAGYSAEEPTPQANHFVTVTGIDRTQGMVFLNDPVKGTPSVMPLAQFEAAWQDSENLALDIRPAGTTMADPAEGAPLVDLTSFVPASTASLPADPALADPSLSAVSAAVPPPPMAEGCCLLPMTLQVAASDPVATAGVAPPVPPAVAAFGVPDSTLPTTSGLSSSLVPPMGRV